MTKITKRENFEAIISVLEEANRPELVAVMEHELELLAKKNSYKSTKPTAKQTENEDIKTVIVEGMESDKAYTITDLLNTIEGIKGLTNQRVTALVNQMVRDGKLVKTIDKRKSYFSVAQ